MHRTGIALTLVAAVALSGCAFVERVDVRSDGTGPAAGESAGYLSADGRYDAFTAFTRLVPGDTNNDGDAYVRDVAHDTTERVSVNTTGGDPDATVAAAGISADGRYVLLNSSATNLVPGGTSGTNLFVRDRTAGTTTLVTVTTDGKAPDAEIQDVHLSADGRTVAFTSPATNLLAGAVADRLDAYVRDLDAGTTSRVSLNGSGVAANSGGFAGGISSDGNLVVFESTASNLPGTCCFNRVFVRNRSAGTTTLVSVPLSGDVNGGALPADHAMSTNGRYVLFVSWADNLTADDPTGTTDVYVRDLTTNATSLVMSSPGVPANGDPPPLVPLNAVGVSDDGRFVYVNGLRTGDITHLSDLQAYVIDRLDQRITLIRAPSLKPFAQPVHGTSISADGGYVTFTTSDPLSVGSFIRSTSAPTVTGVSPADLTRGQQFDLAITGTHLAPGTTFGFGAGITVGAATVQDEQHATVHVTVAADAPTGARTGVVIAPGTGAGFASGGVEVFGGPVTVSG